MTQYVLPLFTIAVLFGQGMVLPRPSSPAAEMAIAAKIARQQPTQAPKLYNETADARLTIANAIKRAATDDVRVLINWGANDDAGSTSFAQALKPPAVPATFFSDEYVLVNVNVGRLDRNMDVAETYGAVLRADDLPALTVLDHQGKVLANAAAHDFFGDRPGMFSKPAITSFLTKYQAPQPNDTANFEHAVQQAKRSGKTVFVWFSAPW